jgi:hypothetical protein
MKQYYINLKKHKQNRLYMESNFPKAERFEAMIGSELTPEDVYPLEVPKHWRDPLLGHKFTKGEVGCVLSHYHLWKICVEINESIIILEDDIVILDPEWEEKLNNYKHYDLVYLGRLYMGGLRIPLDDHVETPGFSYWTSSYMVSPLLAQELIRYCENAGLLPADEVLPLVAGLHTSLLRVGYTVPLLRTAAFKTDLLTQPPESFDHSETQTPLDIWEW